MSRRQETVALAPPNDVAALAGTANYIEWSPEIEAQGDATENNASPEHDPSLQMESTTSDSQLPGHVEDISLSAEQCAQEECDLVRCPDISDPDGDLSEFIKVNSETTLPHQSTTVLQVMLLILTFVAAAGLPWTQVDGLLKLMNAVLGQEVFPSTKYGIRKLWELQQSKRVEVHTYCPTCHFLTTSCGIEHQRCGICEKVLTLAQLLKKGSFFITTDLKQQLLHLLKHAGELVGKNLEQLASSTHQGLYRDITDGALYRKCRSENKMTWSDLTVTVNSDGSPVFRSSKGSLWPIQVSLNELPIPHRWKNILVAAVWFAKEHPPAHLYLKTFVEKFNAIGTLTWTFAGQIVQSTVSVLCCCVDSPARAALLNAKQYNGYYGCSWCFQRGKLVDGTVKYTFEGPEMLERSHSTVISAMSIAAARGRPVDGIKGPSACAKLRSLDLVWGFPPDYLHCVLEGVVAQLMDLWLCSTGQRWYIGNRLKELDEQILKIRPPITFTRLPRPLSERSFWKATEWKYWLLYYGVPTLQNLLPERYLSHFSLLSQSVFILLKTTIQECAIILVERLLNQFVEEVTTLYGENHLTFNVHQFVHLAKSVRMTGPLWVTSTFPFEGGNGEILKLVSAAKGVPQQIAERYIMREVLKSLTRIVRLPPFLKCQQELISGKRGEHHQSRVLGAPLPRPVLENCIKVLIEDTVGHVASVSEYLRARLNGIIVHSAQYRRPDKTCSEYFEASDGKLCRVLRVFAVEASVLLLCQELICGESLMPFLCEIEHPPTNVGLCLLREEDIASPCVFVERTNRFFLAKIPNLYEKD